ncbi:hypothetical protein NESM_000444400 [Novymonas esmeraldas]|uniref:Uncharacterized protein n=1 Tax=Novymonas esmeraldas TaxID=1808958 RepID=A0AAW0EN73_9TRYP
MKKTAPTSARAGAPSTPTTRPQRTARPASNTSNGDNGSGSGAARRKPLSQSQPRAPPSTKSKTPSSPASPSSSSPPSAPPPAAAKTKYTVIISNVENDFGKLHSACLPYYCGLRSDYEEKLDVERLVSEGGGGGAAARRLVGAVRGCSYAVRCRTETRSAEISLYGPAKANFAPMQLTKPPRPQRPTKATASATPAVAAAAVAAAVAPSAGDVAEAVDAAASIGAVEQLALRLRRQHYFESKLPVNVHLPGRAEEEVLVRLKRSNNTAAAAAESKRESAVPSAVKRPREDEDGDEEAAPLQRVKMEEADETQQQQQQRGSSAPTSNVVVLQQFPRRQKDFVTAVAALSTRASLRRVRGRLHDLPGYLACWRLYDRHMRVVFRDAESLFKAKQLLDQFELDNGLRVTLSLSDPLSRTNADFIHAQESEAAEA